ncbi:hypothetical protein L1281_002507 [Neisseria sp. HSC-16F19]|nr:hypothetical protein [Neisseria sp. HSC-16F19]MCP2041889.1 hypothetical protein [Neisseria sp. HSC-16F19]
MSLFEILLSMASFAAGNLTMFFARRYIAAMPEIDIYTLPLQTDGGEALMFRASFKKAAYGYTVLSLRADRPIYGCRSEYDASGAVVYSMETTPPQLAPFFVHDRNIISATDEVLRFCTRSTQPLRLTYWLRTGAFPYFMRGSRLIRPPH